MSCRTNRRGFLKSAALPAAGWVILGSARSARSYQANEKLNVAVVGVGKRGRWHVSIVPRVGQNLVALCDTNAHNSVCALLPEADFPNTGGPPRSLPSVAGHQQEWVAACKGGPPPLSNFNHSGPAIELLLLGNVASLVGEPLEFDPVQCKITNNDEANRALRPEHREGWVL